MQLDVRDAAQLFSVSEKTIYRWIRAGSLPGYRVQGQYRFNRAELLEWATAKSIPIDPAAFEEAGPTDTDALPVTLASALAAGGIHHDVPGTDTASVLAAVVERVPLPPSSDRAFLLRVLLSRESLGSTGIGEGIAVPHVRNPIVLHASRPSATLCFLASPVDFAALDGRPVHTLFTLITPNVRSHLGLLARIGHALRTPAFRAAVTSRAGADDIVEAAAAVDRDLAALSTDRAGDGP
jgi:PTS system nitrogen regulatory IIA component